MLVAKPESDAEELSLQLFRFGFWVRSVIARLPFHPPRIDCLIVAIWYMVQTGEKMFKEKVKRDALSKIAFL